jgi:hypothetical protein
MLESTLASEKVDESVAALEPQEAASFWWSWTITQ